MEIRKSKFDRILVFSNLIDLRLSNLECSVNKKPAFGGFFINFGSPNGTPRSSQRLRRRSPVGLILGASKLQGKYVFFP